MELYNYTIGEVIQLSGYKDYFTVGQALKADNILKVKPIEEHSFGLVKELISNILNENYTQIISLVTRYIYEEDTEANQLKILKLKWTDFFYQLKYLKEELERVNDREKKFLSYEPTAEEMQAGLEDLYKFGTFATIDQLAGGDPLKYQEIEKMPYGILFTKLYLESTTAEFKRNYSKIINRKK